MTHHPLSSQILNLLKQNNYWHETFEHEPVTTSEEAAKIRPGYTLSQGAKALIVKAERANENIFVMLVMPAHMRLDSKQAKKVVMAKSIRFASEEEINALSPGLQRGGVPPFGDLLGLPVFCDSTLFENEKIVFNADDRCFSIAMKAKDYRSLVNPVVCGFVEKLSS